MSIRNTLIMLLLCVGVTSFWYFHDVKGEPERRAAKEQEERVFSDLSDKDIISIRWIEENQQDGERVLERDNDLWKIKLADGSSFLSSTSSSEDTAKQIAELSRVSIILEEPSDSDYATFSLDKPKAQLEVKGYAKDGKTVRDLLLLIGDETPAGDAYYARVKDQKPVLEISGNFMSFLKNRVLDMREKSALIVAPEQVASLVLHQPNSEDIALSKQKNSEEPKDAEPTASGDRWKMEKPIEAKADLSSINDYLWQLQGLKVDKFIPFEAVSNADLTMSWNITTDKGTEIAVELLGSAGDKKWFMKRSNTDEYMIVGVEGESSKLFPKVATDFEDHRVFDFKVNDIDKLELTIPAGKVGDKEREAVNFTARRDGEGWSISSPAKVIDDENKRDSSAFEIAYSLVDLSWKDKLPNEQFKPDNSCSTASIYGKNGEALAVLYLRSIDNSTTEIMVKESGKSYRIDKDVVDEWIKSVSTIAGTDKKEEPQTKSSEAPQETSKE